MVTAEEELVPKHICGEDLGPKGDGWGTDPNEAHFGPDLPENGGGGTSSAMERILEGTRGETEHKGEKANGANK